MRPTDHLLVPPHWSAHRDPAHGVLLSARGPRPGSSGVAPLIRLEVAAVASAPHTWSAETLALLAARRTDFELDDEDVVDLDGHDVTYRRYGFRRGDDDLLCEEWSWLIAGAGYTLTCTTARADYEEFCDLFEDVALSFDPPAVPLGA